MIISCIVLHRKVPDFGFCCGSKLLLLALLVVDRTFSFASIMLWQLLYWFGIRSSTKLYCFSLFYVNPIAEVAIGKLSESAETVLPSVLHSYAPPFRKSQSLLLKEKSHLIVYWLVLFDRKKKLAKRGLLCGRLSLICGFGLSQIGRRNQ